MAQRWRYVRNGQEYGPVTTSDLRLLADSERLQTTDLVCKDGSTHWVAAGSVKGLFYTPGAPRRTSGWAATCVIVVATIALLTVGGVIYLVYTLYGSVPNNASPGPPATSPNQPTPPPIEGYGDKSPDPKKDRVFWRSSKGYFESTNGDQWVEKYENAKFNYVEIDRTNKYVELFDKSRNFSVRLHADHYDVKVKDKFERRLDGKWETP